MPKPKPIPRSVLFYCLAAVLALGLLLWGLRAPKSITLNTETNFPNINDGWCLATDDTQVTLGTLCDYGAGGTISITRTLPETTTEYLLFYTEHQEITVTVGDAVVYCYEIPSGFSFLQTPGNSWHAIALSPADAGQRITITFSCPFAFYQMLPENIFFLQQGELQIAQAYSLWFCNTVAIFMIVLAIVSCVSCAVWHSGFLKKYTLRLGLVYGVIALWLFAEINIATLVLRNDITTYLFSMLLIRLLPLCFYYLLQTLAPTKPRWVELLEWVFAANIFVPFLLQFTLHISLLDTLFFNYLLALLGAVGVLVQMAVHAGKAVAGHLPPTLYELLYFASALLLLGALGEIYCYVNYATLGARHGTAISVAAICYTIVTRIILVQIEAQFKRKTEALAQENSKLQLMPLMQQINAHFLFNTLNNISFLCKRDPKAADTSVVLLAQYMREYMFLVNMGDLIPFSRERALMEAYLSIQQIRFKDKISFSLAPEAPDFYLPPLCIQPFVENAILHGVRSKKDGGNITISRTQEGEFIKITVQDDGVGFDPAALQASNRVGIQNVQKRLALYGGWAAITSIPNGSGSGTTVEVFIPQEIKSL